MSVRWHERLVAIAEDRSSGAREIAAQVADLFYDYAIHYSASDSPESDLQGAVQKLIAGQPSMAPVIRICNDILLQVQIEDSPSRIVQSIAELTEGYRTLLATSDQAIAAEFLGQLAGGKRVVTLSYSSTVLAALRASVLNGMSLSVTVLESRPGLEGRRLAALLAEAGLPVTLAVDSAAYQCLRDADLWLAGADSLLVDGVVNKIGTAPLAAAGQVLGKPGYVLADSTKIWPAALPYPPFRDYRTDEVWADAPASLVVSNRYFELTPWPLITGIISTERLRQPADIQFDASSLPVAKGTGTYFV